jgi:PhnB protein
MNTTTFVPKLSIANGTTDIDFYIKGLGAIELRRWSNDDGTIHVAELSIDGAMFHLHEETKDPGVFSPARYNGVTATMGLMVNDVDTLIAKAIAAGAKETSPATDYDYGYRQGEIQDPFGHRWLIECEI